jgi:hypothetical protein
MTLDLTFSDAKLVLEALQLLEEKWALICETSSDEDEVADYGNDLVELRLLQASTRESAVSAFGQNVTNFDRTTL